MTAVSSSPSYAPTRYPAQLFGGWEFGILFFMAILYIAGFIINPDFFRIF